MVCVPGEQEARVRARMNSVSEDLTQMVFEVRHVVAHEIVERRRFVFRHGLPSELVEVVPMPGRGLLRTDSGASAITQAMCRLKAAQSSTSSSQGAC